MVDPMNDREIYEKLHKLSEHCKVYVCPCCGGIMWVRAPDGKDRCKVCACLFEWQNCATRNLNRGYMYQNPCPIFGVRQFFKLATDSNIPPEFLPTYLEENV